MSFEEFLNAESVSQVEKMAGVKLTWGEKWTFKWWIDMRESNPHLSPMTLFESIIKGRF